MTAQIQDTFRYRKATYSLAGISEGRLLDVPALLGREPLEVRKTLKLRA